MITDNVIEMYAAYLIAQIRKSRFKRECIDDIKWLIKQGKSRQEAYYYWIPALPKGAWSV